MGIWHDLSSNWIHFYRIFIFKIKNKWIRIKRNLNRIYIKSRLNEVVFFAFFLIHRYRPNQMNLLHVPLNVKLLFQVSQEEWLDVSKDGKLKKLIGKWEKFCFWLKNALLLGALQSRVEKVIYFTFVTLTLELNNPFDRKVLKRFLHKKIDLLNRQLKRLIFINGKQWNQADIRLHVDAFHRNSLVQYQVIQSMQRAVRRQKPQPVILEAQAALKKGYYPILITDGCSGAYWMRGEKRQILGLFKPYDEEIHAPNNPIGPPFQGSLGQRKTRLGCRVGEAAHHEVAAFLVDEYLGFGIVPRTYYACFTHRTFFLSREDRLSSYRPKKTKYGSFQEYVGGFVPLTQVYKEEIDNLPFVEYQLLIVLDVIIGNLDRNTGNILIGEGKMAAIDHGLCFPDVNIDFSFWYWKLNLGQRPLIPSLAGLLDDFPFEPLSWKLKKNCFISENSLNRLRERVTLFSEGIKAGLVPNQLIGLMEPDYLFPLRDSSSTLRPKALEQVNKYLESQV